VDQEKPNCYSRQYTLEKSSAEQNSVWMQSSHQTMKLFRPLNPFGIIVAFLCLANLLTLLGTHEICQPTFWMILDRQFPIKVWQGQAVFYSYSQFDVICHKVYDSNSGLIMLAEFLNDPDPIDSRENTTLA